MLDYQGHILRKGLHLELWDWKKNKRRGLDSLGIRKIERSETHLVLSKTVGEGFIHMNPKKTSSWSGLFFWSFSSKERIWNDQLDSCFF